MNGQTDQRTDQLTDRQMSQKHGIMLRGQKHENISCSLNMLVSYKFLKRYGK